MRPNTVEIRRLYRELLRYGQQLQFTDKDYFYRRIRKEFKKSSDLTEEADISFNYKKGRAVLQRQLVK